MEKINNKKLLVEDNRTIEERKAELAKQYGCLPEEIYIGDIDVVRKNHFKSDYKYVVGDIAIFNCRLVEFTNLIRTNNIRIDNSDHVKFPALKDAGNIAIIEGNWINANFLKSANDIIVIYSNWVFDEQYIKANKIEVTGECHCADITKLSNGKTSSIIDSVKSLFK